MLISFSVENFKCFQGASTLSLEAASFDQHSNHIFSTGVEKYKLNLLRFAAIYGANASGKTKFIDALTSLRRIVVASRGPNLHLPLTPFLLGKEKGKSTRFQIQFVSNEIAYEYGLVANSEEILEEWLTQLRGKNKVLCFERASGKEDVRVSIGSGFANKGSKEYKKLELISELVSPNQTFLRKAWENKSRPAAAAYHWFSNVLTIIGADSSFHSLEIMAGSDEDFSQFLSEALSAAGTGISSVRSQGIPIDLESRLSGFAEARRQRMMDDLENNKSIVLISARGAITKLRKDESGNVVQYALKAKHTSAEDTEAEFDFEDESHGTQRLMHLLPMVYQASFKQRVFCVDELDRKLHPLLTRKFLCDFDLAAKNSNSQLVFTTHDTNVLDQDMLRRDEIWFVEKNLRLGSSELYPLTDFDVRSDLKLEKGYLQGRFGAIPFFGDFNCAQPARKNEDAAD
ncbi:MAG: ATP-binding protein [Ramlibacter sp.]|nr:ATP-binding protein [Ramlibacter sp.]